MGWTMPKRPVGIGQIAVGSGLAIAIGFLVPTSSALAEEASTVVYERTAYDGTIWEVKPEGVHALSYSEWEGLGFPSFSTADTSYVRAAPFQTVYAVTWFELAQAEWTEPIDYAQYVAAGMPRPSVEPWIEGIEVHKWPTASELFGTDPAGLTVKLTYAQWSAAGFPEYTTRVNRGFIAMTWDGSGDIAYMCDLAGGHGGKITYPEWVSFGMPTPYRTGRVANDWVYSYPFSGEMGNVLHYRGPVTVNYTAGDGLARALSLREWQMMGSPQPNSRSGWSSDMPDPSCSSDTPSPTD